MIDKLQYLCDAFEDCYPHDCDISNRIDSLPKCFEYSYGETRYAIWCKEWDFVIKIPRYEYTEDDYCAIECDNYRKAVEYKVEKICLPIEEYYTTSSGISLYKQVKYTCATSEERRYMKYLEKRHLPDASRGSLVYRIKDNCYDGNRISNKWMARVLQLYGKKFCRSFEEWTKECRINDLHNNNTGWLKNKPILLDYAGYHE